MNKALSIVIPVFNKIGFTKSCLNDLSKLPNTHELIFVDNGSADGTKEYLENSKEIIYIRNNVNEGFAKACNKGMYNSSGKNIMFLNNDIRVKSNFDNWTKEIIEKCDKSIVGPTMGQLDNNFNFIKEANKKLDGNYYMSGWCISSSREIWNKLIIPRWYEDKNVLVVDKGYDRDHYCQLFSEEFGLAYFEDTDLSMRAKKLKIPFEVINIPVVHFGKITSQQINTFQLYKQAREIFIKKWKK